VRGLLLPHPAVSLLQESSCLDDIVRELIRLVFCELDSDTAASWMTTNFAIDFLWVQPPPGADKFQGLFSP